MRTGAERHDPGDGSAPAATGAAMPAVPTRAVERPRPASGRRGRATRLRGAVTGRVPSWPLVLGTFVAAGIAWWLRRAGPHGARHAPREGARRFRQVVEACPVGLLCVDRDGRITLANPQAARLFGWPPDALIDRPLDELVPEGLSGTNAGHRSALRGSPRRRRVGEGGDVHGVRRDGTRVPIEIALSPIGPPDDGTVLASVVDLTERQAEQRQLRSMLREKTVLLDEVHHRVKNNLQVITSLLSLQARGASPEAQAALVECRNRVQAMALTHQLLHENADVARLHLGEYLHRLARMLADSHRALAPRVALRVDGADTPLFLALPRAIPCGLLVNELVTHSYRRAFPPDGEGTIVVGLAIDGGRARLRVADDGVPDADEPAPGATATPSEQPDPSRPLAWQLVPLLVDQLGGTMSRGTAGEGTCVEVSFPLQDGARR